jgi:hypothetical protein
MRYSDQAKGPEFDRLRANYDAAFARLRAEEDRLRAVARKDMQAVNDARRRFANAMACYRDSRERLAGYLALVTGAQRAVNARTGVLQSAR